MIQRSHEIIATIQQESMHCHLTRCKTQLQSEENAEQLRSCFQLIKTQQSDVIHNKSGAFWDEGEISSQSHHPTTSHRNIKGS
jgi:hypothetical protein